MSERVVCAMSGGVDSSVAALLLAEKGYDVVGVSMQVWDYRNNGGCESKATCCSPDDFTDARRVAGDLNIPYYVFDFERTFQKEVIEKFAKSYAAGITPNPCADCNNKVKFRELRDRASGFGCECVATGHYARIAEGPSGKRLLRGVDAAKDQSYFLYGIQAHELDSTLFPVGHLTKEEVRQLAEKSGLPTARKPESQDICFISGGVGDFLTQIGKKQPKGKIVDRKGTALGEHDGIHQFTVGQRRGIALGGHSNPLYVIEIDAENNLVVVGERKDLERESFSVGELNWISPPAVNERREGNRTLDFTAICQVRHRHKGVRTRVQGNFQGEVKVSFLDEWTTVAPGQVAVFYDEENVEVLGGGRITPH